MIASALAFGWISWHEPKTMLLSGGQVTTWSFFNPLFILPLIAFIGTVIWGYGDLLPFGRAC
ncbi:hypothetical protein [Rhizobium leguminosarum]|uniref:hypothetical protein n=1 Tax=Rhizobium leguminosarum TaxID=384 RepID=UPI0013B602DC|nr:hypothetical protein [Rhizobium leguminosarum]MBY5385212.1 hypothetical protein [Rhizobium leguminosarum]NEH73970.1 hypothetical protein [Rhizobium leguminosarum]